MKKIHYRFVSFFRTAILTSAVLLACSISGCSSENSSGSSSEASVSEEAAKDYIRSTSFKLNTVVTITIYDSEDEALLAQCMELCDKYEKIFSRTSSDSELFQLNHRELTPVEGQTDTYQVSEELADLLSIGLSWTQKSNEAFDIAIAPLTELWDFTSETPTVPADSDIRNALSKCGIQGVSIHDRNITLESDDTAFDLGGIAKGYIADRIKDYLVSQGIQSATINLGGNVLCIGAKPDGTPFKIGVQKPFADRNETAAAMEITDKSVVSSGIYERFFEQDGVLYHHILNSQTGYPYKNDLIAVAPFLIQSVLLQCSAPSLIRRGCRKRAPSSPRIYSSISTYSANVSLPSGVRSSKSVSYTLAKSPVSFSPFRR